MHTDHEFFDTLVVGAGLAGLVAANAAADHGLRVALVDPHPHGGRARTSDHGGWKLNVGAHALYRAGALQRALDEWGITVAGGDPAACPTSGYRDGSIHPLPTSVGAIARSSLLGVRSKARFAKLFATLGRLRPADHAGRTLAAWLDGQPDDLTAVVETLVRTTTFVHAPALLDAGAAIAQLQLGTRGVRYLDGGWQRIVDALTARLEVRDVTVLADDVQRITADGPSITVATAGGARRAATVIVAAGGPATEARLLGGDVLDVGPPVEATCLDLLLGRPAPRHGLFGVGTPRYLTPHSAVADLAPDGRGLLSGIHYLSAGSGPDAPDVERARLRELATALGVAASDIVDERYLHRVTVSHAMPLAERGGFSGRPAVATAVPGVFRAGDWVGPRGFLADAATASARAAADAAAARCTRITA